jgi:hypothetical protein
MAASMKMAVFWVVAPRSLAEIYRHFRDTCCLITQMMEAASTSDMSSNFYQTIWRYNTEDNNLLAASLEAKF